MKDLTQIRLPVQKEMDQFEEYFKHSMKSDVRLLNIVTQYVLRRKGKEMRPLFVFLSARLYGEIRPSAYTAAALIELLHTATLVHDDVVDHSYERRGYFSVNALWKSKFAVLFGDYLLSKGLLVSIQNNEYELLEIVSEAVRQMIEGELLQFQKSRKLNITEAEYFDIIRKKTATLIAACTACGAKAAGNEPGEVQTMKEFGENVGIAFQIKDDLFDYMKDSISGKPTGNDIQEKKLTLPLIHALDKAGPLEKQKILRLLSGNKGNTRKVKEVIDFVNAYGGVEYASTQMHSYKDNALKLIGHIPPSPARDSLTGLVNFTINRTK